MRRDNLRVLTDYGHGVLEQMEGLVVPVTDDELVAFVTADPELVRKVFVAALSKKVGRKRFWSLKPPWRDVVIGGETYIAAPISSLRSDDHAAS